MGYCRASPFDRQTRFNRADAKFDNEEGKSDLQNSGGQTSIPCRIVGFLPTTILVWFDRKATHNRHQFLYELMRKIIND